jgi:hypothetical protein
MNIVAIINLTIGRYLTFLIGLVITVVATLWSIKSASMYITPLMPPATQGLALYPVCLFYIFLAFFIIHMTIEY